MNYTSGPWKIPVANVFRVVGSGGHRNQPDGKLSPYPWPIVADTNPDSVVGKGPEATANARLISAAPELLWFTKQIFNGLDTSMIRMDTPADETLANILRKGRETMAKA